MTIQQLRYFLALCQDLNYTRTAGRLYLSRQALRLSIAALENELCGPLFINVRNHLALTEKGQRFRAQAAPVVEQFDRMCAQAYQDIRSPALRLGISVALVPSYLPMLGDVLEQFRQQYPGIPLETTLLSNDAVCAQLQNGTLDAGLVMDRLEITSDHSMGNVQDVALDGMPPICAAFLQPEHAEHPCVRLLCSFLQEHLRNL